MLYSQAVRPDVKKTAGTAGPKEIASMVRACAPPVPAPPGARQAAPP